MPHEPVNVEEWLNCLNLPEYVQIVPSGCLRPIVGPIIWVDGNGRQMSADEYKLKHGIDPQLAWDAIKEYRKLQGKKV
jgi:hypothetical protein